jgi:hypothetical protein
MVWAPDDYVPIEGDDGLAAYVRTSVDDPFLVSLQPAAARAVDDFCNRQFGQLAAPATFTYEARKAARLADGTWVLPVDDVQDITAATVTVDGVAVAAGAAGYRWWELNAVAKGYPYTALRFAERPYGDVELFAKFGWTAVPAAVPAAVRFQVNRWFVRRESPYGVAGSPEAGSEVRLGARLDPDTRTILAGGRVVRARMPR